MHSTTHSLSNNTYSRKWFPLLIKPRLCTVSLYCMDILLLIYSCFPVLHLFCVGFSSRVWPSGLPPQLLLPSCSLSGSLCFSDDTTMSLVPQFGSSFATFRPALSHSGSTRPFSVILPVPASPPYNRPPGSSSSSPTSKVPIWKVCSPFTSIHSSVPARDFSVSARSLSLFLFFSHLIL